MKRVITYGTYDLLHYGHIELREEHVKWAIILSWRSTDEFNQIKIKSRTMIMSNVK